MWHGVGPGAEEVYRRWIIRFIRHHGTRHPRDLGEPEVAAFLAHLASERNVSASTQTQALCALLFLYATVLGRPLGRLAEMRWAQSRTRLPVVLTAAEVSAVLGQLKGAYWLVGMLLYGAGLRLLECLTLRVKDLDLTRCEIRVRTTKGGAPRVTMVPKSLVDQLKQHLAQVRPPWRPRPARWRDDFRALTSYARNTSSLTRVTGVSGGPRCSRVSTPWCSSRSRMTGSGTAPRRKSRWPTRGGCPPCLPGVEDPNLDVSPELGPVTIGGSWVGERPQPG